MQIGLAGPQHRLREIGPVGRIGPGLRLQAEAGERPVAAAAEADGVEIDIVASVELDAGFGGPDFQFDAGGICLRPGGEAIFQVYNRISWLNALSQVMKVGLEHADAPVLKKFSQAEFEALLKGFREVRIVPERFPVKSRLHHGCPSPRPHPFGDPKHGRRQDQDPQQVAKREDQERGKQERRIHGATRRGER